MINMDAAGNRNTGSKTWEQTAEMMGMSKRPTKHTESPLRSLQVLFLDEKVHGT